MAMRVDPRIISSPEYDIHFLGIEKLHPFDTRKYGHAWQALRRHFGAEVQWRTQQPEDEISREDLLLVHTESYLDSLQSPAVIARAVEMLMLASLPYRLLRSRLLRPMLLATRGTVEAAFEALQNGLVINLSGGYHHASADRGEGFCLYADIPIAIEKLRQSGALPRDQQAVIIDLDAHQGNGYARVYYHRSDVFIFDMYNQALYPRDLYARERIDYAIAVNSGLNGSAYIDLVRRKLPEALARAYKPGIAFYIAGTDIAEDDLLGEMRVPEDIVFERDRFVIDTLMEAGIPLVVVMGGGYSHTSYRMITRSIAYVLERWGDRATTTFV
ncbi:MAG: histone deacetylase [Chloroflexota bacterium]